MRQEELNRILQKEVTVKMGDGLSKLIDGELIRATLELRKEKNVSEDKYLRAVHEKIKSIGYGVTGVLQDVDDKNIYHISIVREDIC